ncbi:MAG: tetratricopeptide repeat protein [Verrucomicrobiota bacterium]|jgi:tetratricopeptide (TPR) repeat protein|nr:tetratricopeptide repeat protein [Verrucomicrobiota bacterium]
MRSTRLCSLALGLACCGLVGCRSLPNPPSLEDGGLVSFPLTSGQEEAAQAYAFYSTGLHYELIGDFASAREAYQRGVDIAPENEELLLRLASTLVLQLQAEDALRMVEAYVARHPDAENSTRWLLHFYQSTGEGARAIQLARQLTVRFPEKPMGWLQLASAMVQNGEDVSDDTDATADAVSEVLRQGISVAQPPIDIQRSLVRIQLARARESRTPEAKRLALQRNSIQLLQDISRDHPGDMETLYTLGDLLVQDEQYDAAITVYERMEQLEPTDVGIKQRIALAYLGAGKTNNAIAVLERAVQSGGGTQTHLQIAELYLQNGDFPHAMEHLRLVSRAQPQDPAAWLKMAAIQAETGESEDAVSTLQEALEHLPDHPMVLEVMAVIRLGQNQYTQAARLLDKVYEMATAENPDAVPSPLFFYNYAVATTHLRRTKDAAEWLRRGVAHDPGLLGLFFQRSLTSTETFRRSATSVLRSFAELAPKEAALAYFYLANLYLSQEKPSSAVKAFENALRVVDQSPLQGAGLLNPQFYFWYGVALEQDGQLEKAVEQFETALALEPEYADALNYLAYLWALHGIRLDEALRHIQTALALDPNNTAYLDTLGWIYYKQGRLQEALTYLRKADQLRPNDPEIQDHIQEVQDALSSRQTEIPRH